ncbi:MAG: VacB/RNase II family 3'-5' exoribonuclease, partial [Phycisphaerae bacterium]|nr:VacB/RNase II family 3'-5' exoribonuclease [Phycisphaerae bacterium]
MMGRRDYRPVKPRIMAKALQVSADEFGLFEQALESLRKNKRITIGSGGMVFLPQMPSRVIGTYESARQGYGFVRPETLVRQGDLFIPQGQGMDAITGDKVVARITQRGWKGNPDRYTGKVIEVSSRGESQFVGTLTKEGDLWFVKPDGKDGMSPISIDDPGAKDCQEGDKVAVEILTYPTDEYYANGVIVERFGRSGRGNTELKAVIKRFRLIEKFSPKALKNTRTSIHLFNVDSELKNGREDIRDTTIITIDPCDARDYDDAISLKKTNDRWELGVHIADVSHFVREGSDLDEEAKSRATSVYLPRHVIPMLPELLSNGVCSLQEEQDRFVKSAYIILDNRGNVIDSRFANSVIRSTKRLTYEQVDQLIDDKKHPHRHGAKVVRLVHRMEELARIIQKRRQKAGMLTLELPRAELVFDDKGKPVGVQPESSTFSHTMIEMFMLEANEAVARLLDSLNVSFLRRTHAEPDNLSGNEMTRVIKLCGYTVPKKLDHKGIQQLLKSAQGKPESFMINLAVLKSMSKAEYSPAYIGHYALASKHYAHFTSPIRRYPDLTVHRLLQAYLDGSLTQKTAGKFPGFHDLVTLGQHCSMAERNAEAAEAELRKWMILLLLSQDD